MLVIGRAGSAAATVSTFYRHAASNNNLTVQHQQQRVKMSSATDRPSLSCFGYKCTRTSYLASACPVPSPAAIEYAGRPLSATLLLFVCVTLLYGVTGYNYYVTAAAVPIYYVTLLKILSNNTSRVVVVSSSQWMAL